MNIILHFLKRTSTNNKNDKVITLSQIDDMDLNLAQLNKQVIDESISSFAHPALTEPGQQKQSAVKLGSQR